MTNFEGLQRSNVRRSVLLVVALFVVLTALVYVLGVYFGEASSGALVTFAVLFSAGSAALSWWQSDRLVMVMTKARIVQAHELPQLHNVVEEVAIAAGLPKPRVAIVDDPAPNAFATGRTPERAIVAVTTGLLECMDRDELQAVVAHEMAHVANRARSSSVAHLWIECPLDRSSAFNRLYSTHPPISDRIADLWRLEGGVGMPPPVPGQAVDPRV